MSSTNPIAVFDSGLGGLSVLRQLIQDLPCENFIYFGDSKNAPYGDKALTEIQNLTLVNIDHIIQSGAKAVVIACNTASSAAAETLRKKYSLPIICIEPAIKQASAGHPDADLIVLATTATLKLEKFNRLKKELNHQGEIISLPCPGLVELIEQGDLDSPKIQSYLAEKLAPYQEIKAVVLGCTHYPFVKKQIQSALPQATIYDSALGVSHELKRQLTTKNLLNPSVKKGTIKLTSSADNLALFAKLLT